MSYADPEAEEKTLETFFDRGKFTPGGETTQLRDACAAVERFIAQELCGNLANAPTFDELWIHFQAVLIRIFGKQDGTAAAPVGGGGGVSSGVYGAGAIEHSWMFAATSFFAVPNPADLRGGARGVRGAVPNRGRNRDDPRLWDMEVMAIPLLSLLLARPPDHPSPPAKNLFAVLLEPQKVWYKFSCGSPPIPPHSLAFLKGGAGPAALFENSRLYTHCISSPPSIYPQQQRHHGVRFHNMQGQGLGGADGEGAGEAAKVAPELSLSTLEYYLFTFAWYALSSCEDFYLGHAGPGRMPPVQYRGRDQVNFRPERVALGWRMHGVKGLTHKNPYMTLLQDYMEAFFPHSGPSICGRGDGGGGGMSLQCELLLRVLIEFWLEGNTVLRPGFLKEEEQQLQQQQATAWGGGHAPTTGVAAAAGAAAGATLALTTSDYDPTVALLGSEFTTPVDVSIHGLLVASTHLLADPRLRKSCRRRLGLDHQANAAAAAARGGEAAAGAAEAGGGGAGALTPALEVLRPHVFGFLRLIFSADSTMHTSSAAFSLAVELWLLWMRPWAAPAISRGGSPDSTKVNQALGAASAYASTTTTSRGSGGSAGPGRAANESTNGPEAWVNAVVAGVKNFLQIEPSGGPSAGSSSSSSHGQGTQAAGAGGRASTGSSRRTSGGGGDRTAGAGRSGDNQYCYDPWGGWVLENYSLYTTLLAAFVRKAGTMSFKGNDGSRDNAGGIRNGDIGDIFADTGGANLRLLHRVSKVFTPDLTSLLVSAQNTVRKARNQEAGGAAGGGEEGGSGGGLSDAEQEVLDGGRKALASIQGPNLVTLESYRDLAEELLMTIADLANPRVSNNWMAKLEQWISGPGSSQTTQRACAISSKVKELFGLPSDWKPRGHGDQGGRAGLGAMEVANMFHPDRDRQAPFFLSRQGKEQLASGRRACKPWDVAYVGDPMYRPRRAWETQALIELWVGLSEAANARWLGWAALPDDGGDSHSSSGLFEDEGSGEAIARGREFQRRLWREGRWANIPRRFNLRPLADVRATLALLFALYSLWWLCLRNLTLGATFATSLLVLAFRLSTMNGVVI